MSKFEIVAFELKEGTEEVELYIVLINGKDGPLFVTFAEAQEWVAAHALD